MSLLGKALTLVENKNIGFLDGFSKMGLISLIITTKKSHFRLRFLSYVINISFKTNFIHPSWNKTLHTLYRHLLDEAEV
jgi:hypothetical protein